MTTEPKKEDMDMDPANETPEQQDQGADERIAELKKKLAEVTDKALRAMADAENTRKRTERERQDTAKFAVSSFARDLLSVADNLKRALDAIPEADLEKNEQLKNIYEGVETTGRELLRVFENNSIKKIEPLGEVFDPNFHEVIFEAEMPGKPAGTIFQVIEPGYMIHDRLLRPARVGVAKGKASESGSKMNEEV